MTTTEIVEWEYKPLAPVGNAAHARQLLQSERMHHALMEILPAFTDDVEPEKHIARLIAQAGLAYMIEPSLQRCTQMSFLESMIAIAETGLSLSKQSGEAYLIPFRDRQRGVVNAQFMPGYRGLIKLAVQTGSVSRVDSVTVFESDEFSYWEAEDGPHLLHKPDLGLERDDDTKITRVYMRAFIRGGGVRIEVMTRKQVEKIRKGAPGKDQPAWRHHWGEMARKTVIRRGVKTIPQSTTDKAVRVLERALELDVRAAGYDLEGIDELVEERRRALTTEWERRLSAGDAASEPELSEPAESTYEQAWSAWLAAAPKDITEAELERRWDQIVASACPGKKESALAPADWSQVISAIREARDGS